MARAASLFRCIVDAANQNGRSHGVPVQSNGSHRFDGLNETASALCHPGKPAILSCDEATRNSSPAVHQNTVGGFSPTLGESSEQGASSPLHSTPYFFTLVAKMVNGTLVRRLFRLWTLWRGMMEQGR
jgi:hypothetical protein